MWLWVVIGVAYYAICGAILFRLFTLSTRTAQVAVALVCALLGANAFWNYLFFRARNLRSSFRFSLAYTVLAVIVLGLLVVVDRVSAYIFLPYVGYLAYANVFQYRLWQLNP